MATMTSFSLGSLSAMRRVSEAKASFEIRSEPSFLCKAPFRLRNSRKRIAAIRLFPSAKIWFLSMK
jgi:hypothetical protein